MLIRFVARFLVLVSMAVLVGCQPAAQPPVPTAAPKPAAASQAPAATAAPKPAATTQATAAAKPSPVADDFPNKPLTFVVHTTPGSTIDMFNRTLAQLLSEKLGQNVVVENKSSGGGAEAMVWLQSRPADGYTWAGWTPTFAAVLAQGNVPFKENDFLYLGLLTDAPLAVMARKGAHKDLPELVAKAKPTPGKLRMGGGSASVQAAVVKFERAAGIKFTYVPFPGGAEVQRAVLGGDVDVFVGGAGESATEGIDALAVTSEERSKAFSKIPTLTELGYNVVSGQWRGMIGKTGVPEGRVGKMRAAIRSIVDDRRWVDFITKTGGEPLLQLDERFGKRVVDEVQMYREVLSQK